MLWLLPCKHFKFLYSRSLQFPSILTLSADSRLLFVFNSGRYTCFFLNLNRRCTEKKEKRNVIIFTLSIFVRTCCEITRWLIGSLSDYRSVSNEQILLSFSYPLYTLRLGLSDGPLRLYSVPYLFGRIILTFLKSLPRTWGVDNSDLIIGFQNVLKVIDGLFGIFHREERGQVGGVCRYGDENTEPVTASENST